jgi:hypothetical protein
MTITCASLIEWQFIAALVGSIVANVALATALILKARQ